MNLIGVRRLALLLAILAFGLLLAGCAGGGSARPAGVKIEAKEFAFSPGNVEVTAGQPVKLTLQNTGALEHDFSILAIPMEGEAEASGSSDHNMGHVAEEPELHVAAAANQNATLEFTPTKPGTYEYWCTVSGHKEAGMIGTLVVKAP